VTSTTCLLLSAALLVVPPLQVQPGTPGEKATTVVLKGGKTIRAKQGVVVAVEGPQASDLLGETLKVRGGGAHSCTRCA
jgi:hypothetical protein